MSTRRLLAASRRALALGLSLSLIALAPGAECWAAAAKTVETPLGVAPTAVPVVAAPVSVSALPALPGALNIPALGAPIAPAGLAAPEASLPAALPASAPSPALPASALSPALQRLAPAAGEVLRDAPRGVPHSPASPGTSGFRPPASPAPALSAFEGLRRALPDFAPMGDSARDASEADFLRRVGSYEGVSGAGEVEQPDRKAPRQPRENELDPNGNPSRRQDPGPDSREDEPRRESPDRAPDLQPQPRQSALESGRSAAVAGVLLAGFSAASFAGGASLPAAVLQMLLLVPSVILHEMAHGWASTWLGDPNPRRDGRLGWRLRDLKTHIDPMWTLLIPFMGLLSGGMMFGGARPVQVYPRYYKNPNLGMAFSAAAGPLANVALAGLGALAFAGLGAAGVTGLLPWILGNFTILNVTLAFFNLLPFFPLDGHHILRAVMVKVPFLRGPAAAMDKFYREAGWKAWIPLIVFGLFASQAGILGAAVAWVADLILGGGAVAGAAQMAGAALPAMAALGLMLGSAKSAGPPALNPGAPVPTEAVAEPKAAEIIVILGASAKPVARDLHLAAVDTGARDGMALFQRTQQAMLADLDAAGVSSALLAEHVATPIATYRRINAVTLRLDEAKAGELKARLEAMGHSVFPNDRRRIIPWLPVTPEDADPARGGSVKMDEVLSITKAAPVHEAARARWGAPGGGWLTRLLKRAFGVVPPQPPVGVIDSGADVSHPLLKEGVEKVVNVTTGRNVDDIGHGTWVTSMVLNFSRWTKKLTHYKAFVDGSASTDDVLRALTASANDGNIVISNSWGSDEGDPKGPDSLLVRKLAEEGHVVVFAAGNAGPRANTVGSPAVVYFKDAKTGAPRVLSVAAADRAGRIASFSSRGPGSPATRGDAAYPHRPDLTAVGYNVEGAWPAALGGDEDGSNPGRGTLKAISGTSMSTPDVAGAIALLCMLFGVTTRGEKLDAVVNAVMSTLVRTEQSRDAEGEGHLNVQAAYEALSKAFTPAAPGRLGLWLAKWMSRSR